MTVSPHPPTRRSARGSPRDREQFESKSQGQAPWDSAGPQPAFVRREEAGAIRGSVLDAGCGTGETALDLASREHEVWGIDSGPVAIERAKTKATERGRGVHFQEANALELDRLGRHSLR
jgi:2-polyprenyl-3-methyl-5-hydroxy-6-metoxy-1,4-benzoquinol methylase